MTDRKTHGYARSRLVPDLPATRPKVCGKCDLWFAAAARQRVCDGCTPAYRRTLRAIGDQPKRITKTRVYPSTTHPAITMQTGRSPGQPETGRAFTYADLCRMWANRARKLAQWMERTGRPAREYPDYERLTGREVSVAIGWLPRPQSWPGKAASSPRSKASACLSVDQRKLLYS
jgi:hypothetical protein